MSDVFFKELNIPDPDFHLGAGSGGHGEMTGRMLFEIEKVLQKEKPDIVIVYGDTNSTLAGALSASKLHIPVAHVEAGLRSFNRRMPEEINRVMADHISEFLFAPTETAVSNLAAEGIRKGVYNVGDVMFDVALQVKKQIDVNKNRILTGYELREKKYILVTIHRADNTDIKENLTNIWEAVNHLASEGMKIFFPVHPRTEKYLEEYQLINHADANLIIAEPVSYTDMIILESNAKVVITDSGGVQKESYFFKTPAVIPRDETEWVEIAEAGWNVLAGADRERIIKAATKFYNEGIDRDWISFYGDGNASGNIIEILNK
jgi:UDP-N-acetylglucosamine 2-epimerase